MNRICRICSVLVATLAAFAEISPSRSCHAQTAAPPPTPVFRLGIIGTTTSHVTTFVSLLNDPKRESPFSGFYVVAAYPGGMPDNPASWGRVESIRKGIEAKGVVIYPTIEAMLPHVDGVLLESVDGRCHLEQARPVIAAGKPFYIDKPVAATLADAIEIFRLAREKNVPVFSSSSLRFSSGFQAARQLRAEGEVNGALTWSPSTRNPCNPGLPWYGIHGIETLFTIMGRGCRSVSMLETAHTDIVSGVWGSGDIGTFRGRRDGKGGYGATIFSDAGGQDAGKFDGYSQLAEAFCHFFTTGKVPVESEETLEIMAFMEAAAESVLRGGAAVSIDEMMRRAETMKTRLVQVALAADGSIRLDGKSVTLTTLPEAINALADESTRIRAIVRVEEGYDAGIVNDLLQRLGRAVLADFIYPVKCR